MDRHTATSAAAAAIVPVILRLMLSSTSNLPQLFPLLVLLYHNYFLSWYSCTTTIPSLGTPLPQLFPLLVLIYHN